MHDDDNNSPDFRANTTKRTIPEDTAKGQPVGAPVVVDIEEDGDTLTYTLELSTLVLGITEPTAVATATADLAYFDIDKATGQITLKLGLSFENGNNGEYVIGVRATDPSGRRAW